MKQILTCQLEETFKLHSALASSVTERIFFLMGNWVTLVLGGDCRRERKRSRWELGMGMRVNLSPGEWKQARLKTCVRGALH
jgi:hypothetical protein